MLSRRMGKKYDVFISYSHLDYRDKNKKIIPGNPISKIHSVLKENNISYWFDSDIYSSAEFQPKIVDAINDSKILLFISSEHSNKSEWTPGEIQEAKDKKIPIIPFKIDDKPYSSNIRLSLNTLHFIDYTINQDQALVDLVNDIHKIIEGDIVTGPGGGPDKRWRLWIGLIIACVCLVGTIFYYIDKNNVKHDYDKYAEISIQGARNRFDDMRGQLWHLFTDENSTSNQIEDGIADILLLHDDVYKISLDSIHSEELKLQCVDVQHVFQAFQDSVKVFLLDKATELRAIDRTTSAVFFEESANKLQ